MTEKELRKLSRVDLLEMLIDQSEELQQTKKRLEEAQKALQDKKIVINNAGSIAEASLHLNGVFEAAQAACVQYMENIRILSERQEAICEQRERNSREQAAKQLAETEKRCAAMEADAKIRCSEMLARAQAESNDYWDEVSRKVEMLFAEHPELRSELLAITFPMKEQGANNE